MLSDEQKAKNLKLAYNKTGTLTSDLFNELVTLITKSSNVSSSMSAEQIRDALSSLQGISRLDAAAIKNISSSVTVTIGTAEVSLQDIVQQILFDINQLEEDSHTHANQSVLDIITDAEDGSKFLNDAGEYSLVDWLSIVNKPTAFPPEAHTHTVSEITDFPTDVSYFNNNGDGSSPYDTVSNVDAKLALKQYLDTGVITGLDIVVNPLNNTKVDILPGLYVISDWSDVENPVILVKHLTSTISGITPQFLNTHPASYIALDADFVPVQFNTQFTNEHRRPYCIIGAAIHSNLTTVNVANQIKAPIVGPINQIHDTIRAIGRINLSGNEYTAAGSGLTINRSAGQIFGLGINGNDWLNPHVKSLAAELTVSFRYRLRSTSLLNGESADTTLINPNQWDNAGVLATVPNNKFTIQRINVFQTGLTRIQRPQTIYDSMDDAKTLMQTENFVTEPNIADNSIFRAFLIIKKGVTNLTAAIAANDASFIPVDKFGNVIGGAGVTLTSASIIAALGFTPENAANKATDFTVVNHALYPSVQAVDTKKLDKIIQLTDTLLDSGWSLVSGLYEYVYANVNITATSIVDMIPDNGTIDIVIDAEILPMTQSSSGSVKLFSKNLPTSDIDVTINIIKN